jgi:uncharacterized protein
MCKKNVLAGGTGFVGKFLAKQFVDLGYEVIIISRQVNHVQWTDAASMIEAINGAEILVNLAGKSVDCRYNEKNKKEIYDSRINTTKTLGEIVLHCKNPPPLWINSSTATIYRHAEDRPMTEKGGEMGSGFSVNVATNWEKTFFDFQLPATRQVALRMAIVLGKEGGVVYPLKNLVRFGLGGKQGSGQQMFSWIHIEDVFNIILFLQKHQELSGVFNTSSPQPVTNAELMQLFRKQVGIGFGLPTPKWLLELGAMMINTETELILKSRWVVPEKLLQAGFAFQYTSLDVALQQILKKSSNQIKNGLVLQQDRFGKNDI